MLLHSKVLIRQAIRVLSTKTVISSKANELKIPQITLHEYIWQNLDKWANKPATICFETKRTYTYYELYKKSLSITRFLNKSFKLKKQETIAIILPNFPEYPIVLLGAIQAGLRVTTCNPNYTSGEIQKQLENCQTKLIFTSSELLPIVRQAVKIPVVEISNTRNYSSGSISFDEISSGEICEPINDLTADNIVVLPYSSGTTGLPKGVQLTHHNLVANLYQISAPEFSLIEKTIGNDQDTVPAFLPYFHIYGMVVIMLQALIHGAITITVPKFTSENFINLLKTYKTDVLYVVPLMVILANNNPNIKKEDLEKIRCVMSGAAPLGATDIERFLEKTSNKVSLIQGYGMTETSPVTLIQTKKIKNGSKIGGSGLLVANTQAKIITIESDSTQNLPPNQPGELIIKGPQVMPGYYNNPQANIEIFLESNWIRTGDIAYYDEDEQFYVVDRCKELIKVKGFQVAPAELEEILRCHPSIEDVGVVGIPHEQLGEAPKAYIVLKSGHTIKTSNIQEYVASKVAKHKQLIGGVTIIDAIPKSASGKILRSELRKL